MIRAKAREEFERSIQGSCRTLFLTSAIPDLVSTEGTMKQVEFLEEALRKEITTREENRRERLVKRAKFPIYKTFDGYEYRCVKLPPALSREELENVSFIEERNNLVLYGPVGIGKTHTKLLLISIIRLFVLPSVNHRHLSRYLIPVSSADPESAIQVASHFFINIPSVVSISSTFSKPMSLSFFTNACMSPYFAGEKMS